MKRQSLHKVLRVTAIVLLFIVSLNALAAGYSFMVDSSGKGLGMTTDYLKPSAPFKNFSIPGIVLFIVNGVLSSIIAVLAIIKQKHYAQLFILQGTILMGWIAVQLTMVTLFHPLHGIIASIGLSLIVIGYCLIKVKAQGARRVIL